MMRNPCYCDGPWLDIDPGSRPENRLDYAHEQGCVVPGAPEYVRCLHPLPEARPLTTPRAVAAPAWLARAAEQGFVGKSFDEYATAIEHPEDEPPLLGTSNDYDDPDFAEWRDEGNGDA